LMSALSTPHPTRALVIEKDNKKEIENKVS